MQSTLLGPSRDRQWGRAGPIMALVSLLIVAALAKVTLAQFGVTPPRDTAARGANPVTVAGAPGAEDEAGADTGAPPAASNAIEKARAVQGMVARKAAETASRIESEGN